MSEFSFKYLPCEATNITQRFGENPQDYEPYGLPYHLGVDFGLWVGDPVYNVAPGTVTLADRNPDNPSGFGIYCIIQHDEHHRTIYGHLNRLAVQAGQVIEECVQIGEAGDTGRSTGPHLHLQLEKDGRAIDPWPYLMPLLNEGPDPAITPPGYTFCFVYAPSTIPSQGYAGKYGLNLRVQPMQESAKIGYIKPGTTFQIIGLAQGDYYPAYIANDLITKET